LRFFSFDGFGDRALQLKQADAVSLGPLRIATSIAALPSLSLYAAKEDWLGLKQTVNFALRMVLYTILPATVGLMVLGKPIIQLLFEHGRFTHHETLLTHSALIFYCLGLPAFSGVKIIVNSFYSLKDTQTPVRVATYCLLVNMAGNLSLMWTWGVAGLAMATTIASYVNVGALLWLLRKRLGLLGGKQLLRTLLQSFGASAVMAAVSWVSCVFQTAICFGAFHSAFARALPLTRL